VDETQSGMRIEFALYPHTSACDFLPQILSWAQDPVAPILRRLAEPGSGTGVTISRRRGRDKRPVCRDALDLIEYRRRLRKPMPTGSPNPQTRVIARTLCRIETLYLYADAWTLTARGSCSSRAAVDQGIRQSARPFSSGSAAPMSISAPFPPESVPDATRVSGSNFVVRPAIARVGMSS